MKRIIPITLAVIVAFLIVMLVDPVSHPKYMIGKWDAEGQAAYVLRPFGICTSKGIPGRWYVKDGYVYLSALFAYENAEIIDETRWVMHEDGNYDREWIKIE